MSLREYGIPKEQVVWGSTDPTTFCFKHGTVKACMIQSKYDVLSHLMGRELVHKKLVAYVVLMLVA
jgi:hypothetical protein